LTIKLKSLYVLQDDFFKFSGGEPVLDVEATGIVILYSLNDLIVLYFKFLQLDVFNFRWFLNLFFLVENTAITVVIDLSPLALCLHFTDHVGFECFGQFE
jgi:hypothetical protein